MKAQKKIQVSFNFDCHYNYQFITFNIYKTAGSTEQKQMVPWHTDNGLFLLLTPSKDNDLKVKIGHDNEVGTDDLDDDAVIVLFGHALGEWLLQDKEEAAAMFEAAPHAVEAMGRLRERAVYARMKVAPGTATFNYKGIIK